jgi:15-cis-phytoene synthase
VSAAVQEHPLQLTTAYGVCRHIARTAAKNFYYGFMVLPRRKRNALSAVYAFMRHADDIADDPQLTFQQRRERLSQFLDSYHTVAAGRPTDDPVFMALRDSQQRFNIPTELLDKLVAGTLMDVSDSTPTGTPGNSIVAYRSFDELYDYCYHVASVVGLVCICIFGYRDKSAENLAEHVGVAFQLTNIIRDVKEDASLGRVYFPEEDLARFEVSAAELMTGADRAKLKPLFQMEAARAREFYRAADELLPLIDEDSQPALWTLVNVYRGVLDKIELKDYNVYAERVRLTTPEKLKIMGRGFLKRLT